MVVATPLSFPDGHIITGKEWQQFQEFLTPLYVRKAAAEFVTASTVQQDDNDLYLRFKAYATYRFRTYLRVQGATAGDFKMDFTIPTGATIGYAIGGLDQTIASDSGNEDWGYNANTYTPIYATVAASTLICLPRGIVVMGSTDGYFRLSWAQGTSSGTATVVDAGSFMTARRIA